MKIGVFDSGHGGVTIFSAIKNLLPREEYRYIADSKNCPYGEKSDQELYRIVTQNVEELRVWGAKIIVIACNTATVKCIAKLRKDYPSIKFVGTEPAIKLAANRQNAKNILVLATPGTVHSERTLHLKSTSIHSDQNIKLLACPGLADAIERSISKHLTLHHNSANYDISSLANFATNPVVERLLVSLLPDDHSRYDIVVLGCTHYPLINALIQKQFPHATILDGSEGVAKQVARLII